MEKINLSLCNYIAQYVHEEVTRGTPLIEIDKYTIFQAIESFENGTLIGENNED